MAWRSELNAEYPRRHDLTVMTEKMFTKVKFFHIGYCGLTKRTGCA